MNGDTDARSVIGDQLDAGERLLWAGMPVQGLHFNRGVLLMGPLAVVTAGLVLFVATDDVGGLVSWAFPMAGLLLALHVLAIAAVVFGNARARARTFYGLTDRRVLVVFAPPKTVRSWALGALENLSVETRETAAAR